MRKFFRAHLIGLIYYYNCYFLVMLNVTSFKDPKTGQIKIKMVGWNVADVANGSIENVSVYHSEKFLL